MTAGWGTGAPRPGEGWRVQSPADSNELCAPSAKSRSFHAEPEAARAFAGPVLDGGKQGREPRRECRNAGGRSRGTARPALPARRPLPSHALASCQAEQHGSRPALGMEGSPQPSGDAGTSHPATPVRSQVYILSTEIGGQLCSLFLIFC